LLDEFDLPAASRFRAEWTQGPRTSLKKLERLRAFFRFAQKRKWVVENTASELKAPKITLRPTLPLTREEMSRTLAAVDKYMEATNGNRLFLYMQKTGEPVNVVRPDFVLHAVQ
jgi:site-specific recombinase XerD